MGPLTGELRRFVTRSLLLGAIAAGLSCGGARGPLRDRREAAPRADDGFVRSNILRSDYAGSGACEPCHADVYRAWVGSPMHRMTRVPETTDIRAPFDGASFQFKDDAVKLTSDDNARFVDVTSRTFGHHVYRVTRVIGGHYREDFAGVEVAEPRARALPIKDPKNELVLPVTFVYSPPSFRLKGYSVMADERPGLKAGGVWNQTCIFCHNTAPYFSSLLGALSGPSAPGYQGEVVDPLLPKERRTALEITRADDLIRAATGEMRFLGAADTPDDAAHATSAALLATKVRFGASHLVEVGIGCESCHGGSREHVVSVRVKPSFDIRSSFVRAIPSPWEAGPDASDRARKINRTCARCHQVLFSRYPFTWEGGQRKSDPGGSHISSGEARDFLLGGCSNALSCTTCHDPHAADSVEKLNALGTPGGNGVCLSCHRKLESAKALQAHAHHDPAGAGAVCIDCHMPRKNMGLGYQLTRYHRVGSPTETARVEGDRPLECALCHVDKTVGELVSAMERFWGKRYDRARLTDLYGDLTALPLLATIARGKAHEQATAIAVLGDHAVGTATAPIAAELVNRYPLVRYFARQALSKVSGRPCDIDLDQGDAQIEVDTRKWLSGLGKTSP